MMTGERNLDLTGRRISRSLSREEAMNWREYVDNVLMTFLKQIVYVQYSHGMSWGVSKQTYRH
jgi:hypothetical protein